MSLRRKGYKECCRKLAPLFIVKLKLMAFIPASIEISPKQAIESADLEGLFPHGTRVYITDVGSDSAETMTAGAKRVKDFGYAAVPHFASRRLTTKELLETRIKMLVHEAGVNDALIIGGGLEKQAGNRAF